MPEYVELHAHSNFSLLDGASSPALLVQRAAALGMSALALTEHNALYSAVYFSQAAQKEGIKPIFGSEITLEIGHHLTLLVANETGWQNLSTLITLARHNAKKGEAVLPVKALEGRTKGLIALSGCRQGAIPSCLLLKQTDRALAFAEEYIRLFGRDHFWIELQHHRREDKRLVRQLVALAKKVGVGYVATNNVHYATPDRQQLQDVMVSLRHNKPLDDAIHLHRPNAEYYLKSPLEMAKRFARYPDAIRNTRVIADQCNFSLEFGLQDLPLFPTPVGESAGDYLRSLCEIELFERYSLPSERAKEQLAHELQVIERSGLANYFLIVWDIVRFAREQNILCQGRGSAANSLVAFLLNISPVDPLKYDLVFERFLSDERKVAPDIDIDFDAAKREIIIQYIYDRYGRDHSAMACTVVTFRNRSALRDVGRMLGLPLEVLGTLSSLTDFEDEQPQKYHGLLPEKTAQQILALSKQLNRSPRHLGIHNGAFILTGAPIFERIPTEPATMEGRTVVQWDKDALEAAGLVKVDVLGLRMLSAISDALDTIERLTGARPDIDNLPFNDPAVFEMLRKGDTVGVFQVESRAQSQVLPRLPYLDFALLIIAISLIRPGPILADMVHPFLRRLLGEEPITYLHDLLKPALAETLGVILFQEQIIKICRDMAGFSAGQGELLRRALGSKNADEAIETFHQAFTEGAEKRGVPVEIAELVFEKLQAFGGYSFPKSHATAFASLVYKSAWLKRYHPIAFFLGILNNEPMGFWSPSVVLNDAKKHGIGVLSVDVNQSQATCTAEGNNIRIGFNYVRGFGETTIKHLIDARAERPFGSLLDFCKRTQMPRRLVENLILVSAFGWLGEDRQQLIWNLGTLSYDPNQLDLVYSSEKVALPKRSRLKTISTEIHLLAGLSVYEHPLELYRAALKREGILSSADLQLFVVGRQIKVAGLNVVHQAPPTAKEHHFVTLEDEHGFINVIIRPHVYARYRDVLLASPFLVVGGEVQRKGIVTNLIARYLRPMRLREHRKEDAEREAVSAA